MCLSPLAYCFCGRRQLTSNTSTLSPDKALRSRFDVVGTLEDKTNKTLPDPERMGVYIWRIEQYSTHWSKHRIISPTFEKGGYQWDLSLHPTGTTKATEEFMTILLRYPKTDDIFSVQPVVPPKAKFSMEIRNQLGGNGLKHATLNFLSFQARGISMGYNFAKIDKVIEKSSGLVVGDVLEVELHLFVQPDNVSTLLTYNSEEAKTVVIRLLNNQQIQRDTGTVLLSDMPMIGDGKTYCFNRKIRYQSFKELVSHDLGIDVENQRFWLCEQLPSGNIRFVLNLEAAKGKLNRISDLIGLRNRTTSSVSQVGSMDVVHLFVE